MALRPQDFNRRNKVFFSSGGLNQAQLKVLVNRKNNKPKLTSYRGPAKIVTVFGRNYIVPKEAQPVVERNQYGQAVRVTFRMPVGWKG